MRQIPLRRQAGVASILLLSLTAAGCFASVAQLDEVNEQVNLNRAETLAADSVRAVQLVQILRSLRSINDSIESISLRLTRLRAETQAEVRAMRQEVNQVLEVTGQSEARLRELREQIDRRARAISPPAALPPAGNDTVGGTPGSNTPSDAELLQIGRDQLTRGGNAAARAALTDLLRRYPESEHAADAQFYIAESHAAEGSSAAADSAYLALVAKYPNSTRAPTALYKRGVLAQTAGRRTAARRLYNDLITRYPSSDEAELARERLRVLN